MKVAVLEQQGFATHSLVPMLRRHFGEANVSPIRAEDITAGKLGFADLLVLPGITGEKSPYPDILRPGREADLIRGKMEQDGLIVYAECAALYWCTSHISYLNSSGEQLEKDGLNWIEGIAKGPKKGLAPSRNFRYADTTIANIEYYDHDVMYQTQICVSNGPALYLSQEEADNPHLTVTSRFTCESDRPVATLNKIIGRGMLTGMAVLPHISSEQVRFSHIDKDHDLHRKELFNALSANDGKIDHFGKIISDRIKKHHAVSSWTLATAAP